MKYAVPFFYSAVSFLPIKEITASRKEKESVHRAKIGRKRCGGTGFFGRKVEKKKFTERNERFRGPASTGTMKSGRIRFGYFHSTRHAENAAEESDRNETLEK